MIPMDFACNVWYPLVGKSLRTNAALNEIDSVFEESLKEMELEIETPAPTDPVEADMARQKMLDTYESAMLGAKDNGVAVQVCWKLHSCPPY